MAMIFRRRKLCLKRLLVVEDEPLIAFENEYVLEGAGYEIVATVDRGEAAMELLQSQDIDALIADINLAGEISGEAVARSARERGLAVLLVTGACPTNAAEYAHACLSKPYRDGELLDALRAVESMVCGGKKVTSRQHLRLFPQDPTAAPA